MRPGEFDNCGCPSHVDQHGVTTVNPKWLAVKAICDFLRWGAL